MSCKYAGKRKIINLKTFKPIHDLHPALPCPSFMNFRTVEFSSYEH